jgi:hypothetical protein
VKRSKGEGTRKAVLTKRGIGDTAT